MKIRMRIRELVAEPHDIHIMIAQVPRIGDHVSLDGQTFRVERVDWRAHHPEFVGPTPVTSHPLEAVVLTVVPAARGP